MKTAKSAQRPITPLLLLWLLAVMGWPLPVRAADEGPTSAQKTKRYLLAHYMPWFEARPIHQRWGWHWTMNRFNPDQLTNGRREAASHYYPLIGLYDSGDTDVLECHVLLMKLAGIDGVIVDWYGPDDFLDYGMIHRNSEKLLASIKKAGLRFAVCYEDRTVPKLIAGNYIDPFQAIQHGQRVMRWLQEHWFADPAYLKLNGRPVFLVFGPQYYRDEEWPALFAPLPVPPLLFMLHEQRGAATGAFDWPQPAPDKGIKSLDTFYTRAVDWPVFIPAAFPRFHDIYKKAGAGNSYGYIADQEGKTYADTLERAMKSRAEMMQLVTWNDWGEGTMLEPSKEFGYRDLETTQQLRRKHLEPSFPYQAAALRLPVQLFALRKRYRDNPKEKAGLDEVSRWLFQGKTDRARSLFHRLPLKRKAE